MDDSEIIPNVILKFNETNTMIQLSKLPPLRKIELLIKEDTLLKYVYARLKKNKFFIQV